jgi:thiazole synthase
VGLQFECDEYRGRGGQPEFSQVLTLQMQLDSLAQIPRHGVQGWPLGHNRDLQTFGDVTRLLARANDGLNRTLQGQVATSALPGPILAESPNSLKKATRELKFRGGVTRMPVKGIIMPNDVLKIADKEFRSRLIVGTGKYRSFQEMARAHAASGAEMVTVAVRRVNLTDRSKESMLDYIDPKKYFILPNTAGCYSAEEAIRTARLAREVGLSNWIKLEVIGDEKTLFPDNFALVEATKVLVKEGFVVLPYTNDDLIAARRLIDAGAAAVMPLGAPIGSGLGIQNPANMRILREMITDVPLIVDAGVGVASDAAIAMELGADAVLMNTGIALAQDAVLMAEAMKHAVLAGRQAYLAGRMAKKLYASASSPLEGVVR